MLIELTVTLNLLVELTQVNAVILNTSIFKTSTILRGVHRSYFVGNDWKDHTFY